MLRLIYVFCGVLVSTDALRAQTSCDIEAAVKWGLADDPTIRASPSASAAILGNTPSQTLAGDDTATPMAALFTVVMMQDGWAKVRNVKSFDGTLSGPDGWIDGQHVGISVRANVAFAAANDQSDVVWRSERRLSSVRGQLLECDGIWALVQFDERTNADGNWVGAGNGTAWVRTRPP
ncbi:MAG: hypothetical protein RLZZ437_1422 [Pseudomonadota bacterium]